MKFQIPVGKINYTLKKNAPKILVGLGGVLSVGAVVAACKATPKAQDILEEAKTELDKIDSVVDKASEGTVSEYTVEDASKDKAIVKAKTAGKLIKTYAPTFIMEGAALGCFFGSHHILTKRNAALSAASLIIENELKDYRQRVVDRFGEEVDKELRYKMVDKEFEEEVVDSKGKTKTVKKTEKVSEYDGHSEFDRWFVDGVPGWDKNAEWNKEYLIQRQKWANRELKINGYLTLNEVYQRIGFIRTTAGASAGWIYDPTRPDEDQIDFGLMNIRNADSVNLEAKEWYLHFNIGTTNVWNYVEPTKADLGRTVRW